MAATNSLFVHLAINIQPVGSFNYFYIATILTAVLYLFLSGIRKKYPLRTWSIFIFIITAFFLIGLRGFLYSFDEIVSIIFSEYHNISPVRYSPSGILFGVIGIIIAKIILGIKRPIADDMIFVIPLMGIIQRMGCFLNGCCYGPPTSLPWAIKYSSAVSQHQTLHHGCFNNTESIIHGVHPTQLYAIIGFALIFILLIRLKRIIRVRLNLALTGVLLLCFLRFILEFWRADLTYQWYNTQWFGLNIAQWMILPICIILVITIIYRERALYPNLKSSSVIKDNSILNVGAFAFVLIIIWNVREIFDAADKMILMSLCYVCLAVIIYNLLKKWIYPLQRFALLFICGLGILSMAQTESDSTDIPKAVTSDIGGWWDIGFGIGAGKYDDVTVHRNCYGDIVSVESVARKHAVYNLNANYNFKPRINQHFRIGVAAYRFNDKTDVELEPSYSTFALYPNLSYDFRIVGMGIGIHIPLQGDNNYFADKHNMNNAYPSFMFRIGPKKIFFVESGYYWDLHYKGTPAQFQIVGGSGFGKDDFTFKIGYAYVTEEKNLFLMSTDVLITELVQLKLDLAVGNKIHGAIGLQFHLGKNRWTSPYKENH